MEVGQTGLNLRNAVRAVLEEYKDDPVLVLTQVLLLAEQGVRGVITNRRNVHYQVIKFQS